MAQFFLALGLILIIAKASSYVSLRLGQPSMVGALFAGVALGPGALGFYAWPVFKQDQSQSIATLAELGFMLLVFGAGLELRLSDLLKWGRVVFFSGWLGVIVTMLAVPPLMLLAHYDLGIALFTAITLAGTGNGVAAQMVLEMDMIRSKVGVAILYAAMIDDILIVLALSMLIAFKAAGVIVIEDVALTVARISSFIAAATLSGWIVLPWLAEKVDDLPIQAGAIMVAVSSVLVLGWAAEELGHMNAITGAFIAGLCLGNTREATHQKIERGVEAINEGLLVPVFFINLGIRTDMRVLHFSSAGLILVLLAVSVLTKLIGCGIGARLGGFDRRSALHLALGMVPRGAVGLAIGSIGLRYGLMTNTLFPQIVLVVLGTTVIAPPLVRWMNLHPAPLPEEDGVVIPAA